MISSPRVWENLPHELLLNIWSFLPMPSLLRFRSLNSFFNSLPSQPDFQDLCFTHSSSLPYHPPPLFLKLNGDGPIPCYSPLHSKWSLLAPAFVRFEGRNGYSSDVLASAQGLICCSKSPHLVGGWIRYSKDPLLVIGNPFTMHKVYLPPPPVFIDSKFLCKHLSLMITGSQGGELAFKVVLGVYCEGFKRPTIIVFDSTLSQWSIPAYPAYINGGEMVPQSENIMTMDGFGYLLINSPTTDIRQGEFWLLGVPIESPGMLCEIMGRWMSHEEGEMGTQVYDEEGQLLQSLPVITLCIHLVECKGQVGIAGLKQGERDYTLGIFVYDKPTKSWKEGWVLPEDMAEVFLGDRQWQIGCATAGDFILFTSDASTHGILFDTSQESWSWASDCPQTTRMFATDTVLSFHPRLDTRPQPCIG